MAMFSVYIESVSDDMNAVLGRSDASFPVVSKQIRCTEYKQSSEDRLKVTPCTLVSHSLMERLPPIREPPTRQTVNEVVDIAKKPWKDLYSSPLSKRRQDAATASTVASTIPSTLSILKQQREAHMYKSSTRDEPAHSKLMHARLPPGTARREKAQETHLIRTSAKAKLPDRNVLQDMHVFPEEQKTGIKQFHHGPMRRLSYLQRTMQRRESMRSRSKNTTSPIAILNSCIQIAKDTVEHAVIPLSSRSRFSTVSLMSGCSSRRIRLKAPTNSALDIHS